jgi:hypothetical protein
MDPVCSNRTTWPEERRFVGDVRGDLEDRSKRSGMDVRRHPFDQGLEEWARYCIFESLNDPSSGAAPGRRELRAEVFVETDLAIPTCGWKIGERKRELVVRAEPKRRLTPVCRSTRDSMLHE